MVTLKKMWLEKNRVRYLNKLCQVPQLRQSYVQLISHMAKFPQEMYVIVSLLCLDDDRPDENELLRKKYRETMMWMNAKGDLKQLVLDAKEEESFHEDTADGSWQGPCIQPAAANKRT